MIGLVLLSVLVLVAMGGLTVFVVEVTKHVDGVPR